MNINIKVTLYGTTILALGYVVASLFGVPGWTGSLYVGIITALILFTIYFWASANTRATFIETGEIKFIVRGESVERVLENIEGWHYNEQTGEMVEDSSQYHRQQAFLEEWLGIYWVSIFYPAKSVHYYDFEWPKLLMGGHPPESSEGPIVKIGQDGNYAIQHRDERVDSLYFRYPYPVYADEVELQDNFKIDILVNVTFQVVFPKVAIFILKGKWLPQATAAVNGAITDLTRDKDFETFRKLEKQTLGNELSERIMLINGDPLGDGKYGPGIISSFGVKVHKVDFIKYDLSAKYQNVIDASTAEKEAKLRADARIAEAQGAAKSIELEQGAEAAALERLLKAANTHPLGGQVLIEQTRTKGLTGFTGQVLSLGGDRTGVMVNVPEKKEEKPTSPAPQPAAGAAPK